MFMLIFLALIYTLSIFFGSVSLKQDELSQEELSRRAKHSKNFALRLRRQKVFASLIVMVRLGAWLFLILFIVLATVWQGWLGGFLIAVMAAAVYPLCTRLGAVSRISTRLYGRVEPHLLVAAEKIPAVWKFFYGRIPESLGRQQAIGSREELRDVIAASSGVITDDERRLLVNGLTFRERKVKDVMTPRSVIQSVGKGEFLGPLVLDELHSFGHGRLPVVDGDLDHVVGVLHLRSLLSLDVRTSETAEKLMEAQVLYIHEEDSLQKALTNFIKKRHHLFIVVNTRRETVGLITLEDVMESLIGKRIVDEDDVYEDMRTQADKKGKENNNSPNGIYL